MGDLWVTFGRPMELIGKCRGETRRFCGRGEQDVEEGGRRVSRRLRRVSRGVSKRLRRLSREVNKR